MRLAVIVALAAATLAAKVAAAPTEKQEAEKQTPAPKIYYLHIKSDIRSRYAKTLVTSKIANPAEKAQEVVYQITIPESAFISNFTMLVDNELMEGQVRERVEAKHEYHAAQQAGQSAGHVATATVRDSNQVRISVNVAAQSKVTFNLTYEELLVRRKGRYELAINVNPGQVVPEMAIDVFIEENRNITLLQVPEFRSTNEIDFEERDEISNYTTVEKPSNQKVHLRFAPTESEQVKLAGGQETGLGGKFVVRYDVDRKNQPLSEILTKDGYFVHFFSPPETEPLPKHVVFVLDVSGSMYGKKMLQLKEAMDAILAELRPKDFFNLIEFSHPVTILDLDTPSNSTVIQPQDTSPWYEPPTTSSPSNVFKSVPDNVKAFPATAEYIKKAKEAVEKMTANGGTNIHDSVKAAIEVTKKAVPAEGFGKELPSPLIIFLTDGEATVGETRPEFILNLISNGSESGVPLFNLAFGNDADLKFLKRLSLRSGAFARKIYEAADAALQLRDFYRQVASPLLTNVTFDYDASKVDSAKLTKQKFDLMFSGSEFVVAGKLRDNNDVEGTILTSKDSFPWLPVPGIMPEKEHVQRDESDNFLQRLWAFLSIKQQLDRYEAWQDNKVVKEGEEKTPAEKAKSEALKLALQFSFVTPLTSLVVVKKELKADNTTKVTNNETNAITIANEEGQATDFYNHGGTYTSAFTLPASQAGGDSSIDATEAVNYSLMSSAPQRRKHTKIQLRRPAVVLAGSPQVQNFGLAGPPSYPQSSPGLLGAPPQSARPSGASGGFGGAAPALEHAAVEEEELSEKGAEDMFSPALDSDSVQLQPESTSQQPITEQPSTTETPFDISAIPWLVLAQNQANQTDWQLYSLGNGTDFYKIASLSKGQNLTGDKCEKSSSPSTCKPIRNCLLRSLATSTLESFVQNLRCDVTSNGESFLGICCPGDYQEGM